MSKQRLQIDRKTQEKFSRIRNLDQLKNMDPILFEHFVGYLYQQQGYQVSTTVSTGDEGVDLFLQKGGNTAVVQCKRYGGTVGQPTVRDLYGAMMHNQADGAMLVTTGTISRPAEEWAQGKPIQLIDGHELMSWTRSQQSSATHSPRRFLNWRIVMVLGLILICGLASLAGWSAWQLLNARPQTLLLPPPTRISAEDNSQATVTQEPTLTTVPDLAPTVTIPATTIPTATIATTAVAANIGVPRLSDSPVLDGDLVEWAAIPGVLTPFIAEQQDTWDGSLDVEADWRLGWDADNLYLAIRIVDDVHVQTQEAQFAYRGDSLELELDTNIEADYATAVNQDDFQYVFSPGNFNDIPPGIFRFQGDDQGLMSDAPGSQASVIAIQTDTGYQLEAIIPWRDMNVMPQEGLVIGAALNTNDNDSPGVAKQELLLSHVATRIWADPTSWGTITLLP